MFFGKKKKQEEKKPKSAVDKIVMGAIIGTAIGSVIGLTVAPKKGKETREDIKTKLNPKEIIKKGKQEYDEHKDEMAEIGQLTKETIKGVGTLIRNRIFKNRDEKGKHLPDYLRDNKNLRQIPNEMDPIESSLEDHSE